MCGKHSFDWYIKFTFMLLISFWCVEVWCLIHFICLICLLFILMRGKSFFWYLAHRSEFESEISPCLIAKFLVRPRKLQKAQKSASGHTTRFCGGVAQRTDPACLCRWEGVAWLTKCACCRCWSSSVSSRTLVLTVFLQTHSPKTLFGQEW